jgi:2-keto-3-deoxy-L-arabinonate dehydratase
MNQPPFRGIYPILYAFFDSEGRLEREAIRRQIDCSIQAGCHGLAALGLATEVNKLTEAERFQLMEWVAEDVGGRVPLAFTVNGNSVEQQIEYAKAAADLGASWVILQPPPVKGLPEIEYIRFFGAVADQASIPVAIQNAPEYIGIGLSVEGIKSLNKNHPNFSLLKGEGPVLEVQETIEALDGAVGVFNGRGGLELPDNLRAGCAGMVPATDTVDYQSKIYDLMQSGDEAEAERLYQQILPFLTYIMQSLDMLLCYGKRIAAIRMGIKEVHDRAPSLAPTEFGMERARAYAKALGKLE